MRAALAGFIMLSSNAFAQDAAVDVPAAQSWPEYKCHAPQEGKGLRMSNDLMERLDATATMPAAEAVVVLEDMLKGLSKDSVGNVQLPYELAWRYQELGRPDDLRRAARRAIESSYVIGRADDSLRALLAQSYADEGDWQTVVALLQPMIDAACRPVPDAVRKLLATASIKQDDFPAGLAQLDHICMIDEPEELQWIRSALEMDCKLNGVGACVNRILRYAAAPEPSAELQRMLNDALIQLQAEATAKPYLDKARDLGALTTDYRVIAKEMPKIETLEPLYRIVPKYPYTAAQSGFVVLQIRVDAEGKVLKAEVIDASPPGVFDAAALKAAKKGRFKSKRVNGQPVETGGQYTVTFRMRDDNDKPSRAPDTKTVSAPRCR